MSTVNISSYGVNQYGAAAQGGTAGGIAPGNTPQPMPFGQDRLSSNGNQGRNTYPSAASAAAAPEKSRHHKGFWVALAAVGTAAVATVIAVATHGKLWAKPAEQKPQPRTAHQPPAAPKPPGSSAQKTPAPQAATSKRTREKPVEEDSDDEDAILDPVGRAADHDSVAGADDHEDDDHDADDYDDDDDD